MLVCPQEFVDIVRRLQTMPNIMYIMEFFYIFSFLRKMLL